MQEKKMYHRENGWMNDKGGSEWMHEEKTEGMEDKESEWIENNNDKIEIKLLLGEKQWMNLDRYFNLF